MCWRAAPLRGGGKGGARETAAAQRLTDGGARAAAHIGAAALCAEVRHVKDDRAGVQQQVEQQAAWVGSPQTEERKEREPTRVITGGGEAHGDSGSEKVKLVSNSRGSSFSAHSAGCDGAAARDEVRPPPVDAVDAARASARTGKSKRCPRSPPHQTWRP